MPLITLNIPDSLGNSITDLLTRIANALERIAGPELQYSPPRQATLNDLTYSTPEAISQVKEAETEFAQRNMLVPGSPAYLSAIGEFEQMVAQAYGEEAVNELPWRMKTAAMEPQQTEIDNGRL